MKYQFYHFLASLASANLLVSSAATAKTVEPSRSLLYSQMAKPPNHPCYRKALIPHWPKSWGFSQPLVDRSPLRMAFPATILYSGIPL